MTIQTLQPSERDIGAIARIVIELCKGHSNAVVSATLTANANTTTVPAPTCSETSIPLPVAMSANAAAELGNGTFYIVPDREAFVIHHANNAQTDRTFGFYVAG